MSFYCNSFLAWKKSIQLFSIFLWYHIKIASLINLKDMTVIWLIKMAKFMWVNFNCPCVYTTSCLIAYHAVHQHQNWRSTNWDEFAICTSSQDRNERWKLMPKLFQFTGVHFADLNPNSYDNLNNMKLKLDVSTIYVKFSTNDQSL